MRGGSPRNHGARTARQDEIARRIAQLVPKPSIQFRLKAWREFQRALDPLAPPKPLPRRRREDE